MPSLLSCRFRLFCLYQHPARAVDANLIEAVLGRDDTIVCGSQREPPTTFGMEWRLPLPLERTPATRWPGNIEDPFEPVRVLDELPVELSGLPSVHCRSPGTVSSVLQCLTDAASATPPSRPPRRPVPRFSAEPLVWPYPRCRKAPDATAAEVVSGYASGSILASLVRLRGQILI